MNDPENETAHRVAQTDAIAMDAQWLKEVFASLATAAISQDQSVGSLDWVNFATQVRTRFATPALKDHVVRETVDKVTDVARQYHDAGQLRSRIAEILIPVLGGSEPQMYTVAGKGGRYLLVGTAKPAGTAKELDIGPLTYYMDAVSGHSYYRLPEDFVERTIPLDRNPHQS